MSEVSDPPRIRRVHATDPPKWWCAGEFDPEPVYYLLQYPVHHCWTCGEDLFIDYTVDPKIPAWEDVV